MGALLGLIPLRAWAYIALAAGLLVGYGYWHHRVYASGEAAMQVKIDALQTRFNALAAASNQCATALDDVNAKAAMDKANSDAQMKEAAKMIQQLGRAAVQAQTDLADARQKLANAAKSPNCATTASLKLCSAMRDY